jgi:6-methylsalicylate decarboxylase
MCDMAANAEYPRAVGAIDLHAHYVPPSYRRALAAAGIDRPDGFPHIPDWSATAAVETMDAVGIERALMSISSPGVDLGGPTDPVRLTTEVNDEGAAAVRDHPQRLGLLASLPLPGVDTALAEIARALDELAADGFVLMTNYRGIYLGDPRFDPVLDELNRRGALVALHPTSPPSADAVDLGRPRPMIEFPIDATRAVVNLILSGTLERCPRIRFVVPHVGAALPVLADRVQGFTAAFARGGEPVDVHAALRRLWFDVAGDPLPNALAALIRLVGPERILYGSDLPFCPLGVAKRNLHALLATDVLDEATRDAVLHHNAVRLDGRLLGLVRRAG